LNKERLDNIRAVILSEGGYIPLNKELARTIGLHEAIIYAELVNKCIWYTENNRLNEFDEFYCTVDELEHDTTIAKRGQAKALEHLEKLGLLVQTNRVPNGSQRLTRHIRIVDNTSLVRNLIGNETQAETPLEKVQTF
jgi:hypothetical protein